MPRRRRPKIQQRQRRFFWMQWRLRRANGSATARRPYLAYRSALPRGCCGGVSISAGEASDSAVIDSRYKPARQRAFVEDSFYLRSFGNSWFKDIRGVELMWFPSGSGFLSLEATLERPES
jgi:hypothetical protein